MSVLIFLHRLFGWKQLYSDDCVCKSSRFKHGGDPEHSEIRRQSQENKKQTHHQQRPSGGGDLSFETTGGCA